MHGRLPPRLDILDSLLDKVHPPVARLRILSEGLAPNHTLDAGREISGSEACLACGSCVDACPVVATKPEHTIFVRTSMLLENVVGGSCRRCFRCVAACPQVTPVLKDYVRSFRSVERGVHWAILVAYLALMTTGIVVHHWGEQLPTDLHRLLGTVHRTFGIVLVVAPLLWFLFDRDHALMAMRRSLSWSRDDAAWFRDAWRWLTTLGRAGRLERGAFNPGQRGWYLFVPVAIGLLGVTGALKWLGPEVLGKGPVTAATTVHVVVGVTTDVLLLLHVWLKLGAPVVRGVARRARLLSTYRRMRTQSVNDGPTS
jgi:cytochrome b subunit of formate dehydrogenase/NAD-dependent dihydropyrimidine dehydrogenase PreA subunit